MVISDKYRFIFVHIPKSGGTSCSSALTRVLKWRDRNHWALSGQTKHETLMQVKYRLEHSGIRQWCPFVSCLKFTEYFSFGFVRNPWDRIVSVYHYLKESNIRSEIKRIDSFNHFVNEMGRGRKWIIGLHSMRPQIEFFTDDQGKIIADFIGRYESLDEDFNEICETLGLQTQLSHLNPSEHKHYQEYYTSETRDLVAQRFASDIAFFDYTF